MGGPPPPPLMPPPPPLPLPLLPLPLPLPLLRAASLLLKALTACLRLSILPDSCRCLCRGHADERAVCAACLAVNILPWSGS